MTIPAIKNFQNYNKYKTESGYTKQGELQQYMQNQNDCLTALTDTMLWQPETTYEVNKIIVSPSMPTGVRARVTTAGKTGDTEPTWTAAETTVSNGTVIFIMESLNYVQLIEEFYKKALLDAHPVGSYYFSDDPTNPSTLFGGTWKAVDPGRALVAQGTVTAEDGEKLEFKAGNTYGEFKHQLTVGELANHEHGILAGYNTSDGYLSPSDTYRYQKWGDGGRGWHHGDLGTSSTGGSEYHNNISPCLTAYGWIRFS